MLGSQVGKRTMRKLGLLLPCWTEEGGGGGEVPSKVKYRLNGLLL